MKICFIADAGSIHTQRWVNYFANKGHEIHLISFRVGEGYAEGVRIYLMTDPLPLRIWAPLRSVNVLARIVKIRRLVKRIRPDVINAHYITHTGYLAALSGFHPIVLTAWGSDVLIDPRQELRNRLLINYALRKADLLVCDSETMHKELISLGTKPTKIRMVYNGIDTQEFSPMRGKSFRDKLGIAPDVPVVISDRTLRPLYNVKMLIQAVPLVLKQLPQTRFIVIGEGEQREYLETMATSLGVQGSVQFMGWITHDVLPNYLASSDVYVSTSLSDSTSLSLQEAMACELAPVVTDLPANREWVTDGTNGFLVPVNDVPALAERIVYLIKNEETRREFGRENRKIIQSRAEYSEEMAKVERTYQEQIEHSKRQRTSGISAIV